ncbi:hypothetical protein C5167_039436 [Papaver somniferum]|uniref:Uncharacterized protein n=1 Tax=Papaver somniferum TaxID=3469 RepID=A0A4Y7IC35_PAPSO|nr:hypothetical protein C5167_039436 [Papaver somniferum]
MFDKTPEQPAKFHQLYNELLGDGKQGGIGGSYGSSNDRGSGGQRNLIMVLVIQEEVGEKVHKVDMIVVMVGVLVLETLDVVMMVDLMT